MPLSSDSLKVLESVKKTGNPCRFVLVKKAGDVAAIAAYRKGSDQTQVANAKDEAGGGGETCSGVIDGQGVNLRFALLSSEYKAAPVKDSKLKDFLKGCDKAFKDNKASFAIVDALPKVAEDDDQPPQGQTQQPKTGGNQQPVGNQTQPQQKPPAKYRTADEWKAVLNVIQQETDPTNKAQLLMTAARDCKAEGDLVKLELQVIPDSVRAKAQSVTLGKVSDMLKLLNPQSRPLPPKMPPLPSTPPPARALPLTPPQQQQLNARQAAIDGTATRVKAIEDGTTQIYAKSSDRNKILQECETDTSSDFGKIIDMFDLGTKATYDDALSHFIKAKQMATSYIKDHGEPKIGKLPSRVVKRKEHSAKIITDIDKQLTSIGEQNLAAVNMAQAYQAQVGRQEEVPFDVAVELEKLLKRRLLSDDTKQEIRAAIDAIKKQERQTAFDALNKMPGASDRDKAEILNRHGIFGGTSGGTSDVRLLQNEDKSIAFAYKSVDGESAGGLNFLNLPKGASSMREDISSTICQAIKAATKLDLGFPEASVVRLDGKSGALIQGIKGRMADPDELNDLATIEREQGTEAAEKKKAEIEKNLTELPDQVSAESMQDVVLSSVLTCQWDCKWGNMIVDGNRARPIDGGTAIPTKDVIKTFMDKGGPPSLQMLTIYPLRGHPKAGQPLPQAQQPMNAEKVAAILKIKPDDLMAQAKARRNQLLKENPDFDKSLMDDSCFDIVKASIEGAQGILKKNPTISLADFALAYEKWFTDYAATV